MTDLYAAPRDPGVTNVPPEVSQGCELRRTTCIGSGPSGVYQESYFASDGSEFRRCIGMASEKVFSDSYYDVDGMLHREDGPANFTYFDNGRVRTVEYRVHGKKHRHGGLPARKEYDGDGALTEEVWYVQGELSRIDGPTWVSHRANGPESKWWAISGLLCTPDRVFEELLALDLDRATMEIEASAFGFLLVPGVFTTRAVLDAFEAGVRTVEGVRGIRDGAPVEWARSWESGSAA